MYMPFPIRRTLAQHGDPSKTLSSSNNHYRVMASAKLSRTMFSLTPAEKKEKQWSADATADAVIAKSAMVFSGRYVK